MAVQAFREFEAPNLFRTLDFYQDSELYSFYCLWEGAREFVSQLRNWVDVVIQIPLSFCENYTCINQSLWPVHYAHSALTSRKPSR